MIDRREWIKACMAATAAAMIDRSYVPPPPDPEEDSSVSWMSNTGDPAGGVRYAWGDSDSEGYRQRLP